MSWFRWLNRQVRIWWPIPAALTSVAILLTMLYVVVAVTDDRTQLREQRDLLAVQSEQLAAIIERDEAEAEGASRRLQEAIGEVEHLLVGHFADHDYNVAVKLNDLLAQIAALHDRPVTQVVPAPAPTPRPERRAAPASPPGTSSPPTRPMAPTTTTTTTPDQRRCAVDPDHPRC